MKASMLCPCFALVASSMMSACASPAWREDDHTLARTRAEGALEGRPTLGMPIAIPGRPTCLIPYSLETRKRWFEDDDPWTHEGYFLGASRSFLPERPAPGGSVRWHNAILSDLSSGEQWPILSRRGVIERWGVLGRSPKSDEPFLTEAIVFIATIEDTNHDGLLDDRDAAVAIVTDADGRNPRQVTPGDAQVWNYRHDEETSHLYFLVVADTNADGKLTSADAPVPFTLDLAARETAVPVVSEDTRRQTESMLM